MNAHIDGLDDFSAETPGPSLPGSALLSDVVPAVSIRWDEAVAIVQEVIEMLSADGNEQPVPGLDAVLIHASGTVTCRRAGRGERGPVAAGRMLHALLASADVPVALRLFVSQATAPETHATLRECAAGLAYFGKPGRADLIRAVYSRYAAAGADRTHRPPSPSPVPTTVHEERKKTAVASNRRLPSWLVPAVATLAVLAGLVWVVSNSGFGVASDAGATAASEARPKKVLPEAQTKPAVAGAASSSPRVDGPRSATRQSKATPSVVPNVLPQSSPAVRDGIENIPLPIPVVAPAAEAAPSIAPALASDTRTTRAQVDLTIYTGDDNDVRPPTMRSPQLPAPLMISAAGSDLVNRMEIVVAADGSVERVRLVGSPARMPDMMLLSGAKLWKFTPATKDGEPVRYRTFVTWSGFP